MTAAIAGSGLCLMLGAGQSSAHQRRWVRGVTIDRRVTHAPSLEKGGGTPPAPARGGATTIPSPPARAGRTWPNASNTGADPSTVTGRLMPNNGDWYFDSATNDTIQNVELDGAIAFMGTGTLTLRNVILRPDWTQVYATVTAPNKGSLVLDHVTIAGVNVGQGSNYTKGFLGSGNLDVGFSDISGICQNDVGTGSFNIHDNYIHDIGTGDSNTCHGTPIEDESGGAEPRIIEHNTLDEAPGRSQGPGATDGIFLQPLYGPISPITIDNNLIHLWDYGIEIGSGSFPVEPQTITNNCFVTPGGAPLLDPSNAVAVWLGNTSCGLDYADSGQPVSPG